MTQGWIINLWDDAHTCEVERDQQPVIYLPESNEPVFEVWFWHVEIGRWFVMSRFVSLGHIGDVIYFDPTCVGWKERLREVVRRLGGSDADGKEGPL